MLLFVRRRLTFLNNCLWLCGEQISNQRLFVVLFCSISMSSFFSRKCSFTNYTQHFFLGALSSNSLEFFSEMALELTLLLYGSTSRTLDSQCVTTETVTTSPESFFPTTFSRLPIPNSPNHKCIHTSLLHTVLSQQDHH